MQDYIPHAQIVWDYLCIHSKLSRADFMLVLGSADLDVARYAAEFWQENLVEYVVVAGGFGKITKDLWSIPEAQKFADIMIQNGVPKEKIILEETSTNTGENILNSKKIISSRNLPCDIGILITKPHMQRRAFNTASKRWPEVQWHISSEKTSFLEYLKKRKDPERFINLMVGDLQRIKIYGENGFQIKDTIPKEVWESYEVLVQNGFDKHIIK